jgi:hypothetical protein
MIAGTMKENLANSLNLLQEFITQDGSKLQVKQSITTRICLMDFRNM